MEKIKVLELFAGYGGASFGLKKADIPFEIIGFSEIDKIAIKCYEQNHKGENLGDITKIDETKLKDFDLLTGGFPCQAFSLAGLRKGFEDTRGTLIYDILRIAKHKQPKYIVLENVKGLLNHNKGDTFKTILLSLEDIGYNVKYEVLNSKDYGTPQNRQRIWLICIRKDLEFYYTFPKKEVLNIKFKNLLEDLPFREIPNFLYTKFGDRIRIEQLKTINDDIFHTMTTKRTHSNQYLLNKEKNLCRNFNKKESMRLMGFFNDGINLNGLTDNQAHKLAGNGWDINVSEKIFLGFNFKKNI
jgi:DNA (cytosine-5)-methyltransferase 1